MINFVWLIISLLIVVKSADYATRSSVNLAKGLNISKYTLGFLLLAVISALPETFISIISAAQGEPSFGLGVLFGSNVADITLVFAIITFLAAKSVKVESQIIKNSPLYALMIVIPIFFGLNGHYSRLEGIILILSGLLFYFWLLRQEFSKAPAKQKTFSWKDLALLIVSMATLILGAEFTVKFSTLIANDFGVSPVVVGMFLVALGTVLPELFLSIEAVKERHDGLAVGDILGMVITDATIVVGVLAVIDPFVFNQRIVLVTGIFMLFAIIVLLNFMRTDKALTKKEGLLLLFYYLLFIFMEFLANNYFH